MSVDPGHLLSAAQQVSLQPSSQVPTVFDREPNRLPVTIAAGRGHGVCPLHRPQVHSCGRSQGHLRQPMPDTVGRDERVGLRVGVHPDRDHGRCRSVVLGHDFSRRPQLWARLNRAQSRLSQATPPRSAVDATRPHIGTSHGTCPGSKKRANLAASTTSLDATTGD